MRENFPHKQAGDTLSSGHVNKLSAVARRMARAGVGNNIVARHGESSFSQSGQKPWRQITFIVTNTKIDADDAEDSGLYLGKTRWYDPTSGAEEWKTDEDGTEWELDASDHDLTLAVGDKLAVWWDRQRGMYVPAGTPAGAVRTAFVDYKGSVDLPVPWSGLGVETNEIRFGLFSGFGFSQFLMNDRTVTLNAHRITVDDESEADVTAVGFYSFAVVGGDNPATLDKDLFVLAQTDIKDVPVTVVDVGLKFKAKSRGERIEPTEGSIWQFDSVIVDTWEKEAESNNASGDLPRFEIDNALINVFVPPGEVWVIEVELMMTFGVGAESSSSISASSSSTSTSSTSSISTSSASTSSSSISASSSSESTSSPSSSTSSISSSGTITHTRVQVDTCCEDDDVIVVYTDLLHDSSGHFLGTTGRDPPDACLGDD